jgi:hypothetical protein
MLNEQEADVKAADVRRKNGISLATSYQFEPRFSGMEGLAPAS